MSLFADLTTDSNIAPEKDVISQSGPMPSGLFTGKIMLAYAGKSDGGARSVTIHIRNSDGREHRETVYVTSGAAKGGKNYYEKDGERHYLPGFQLINGLCLLTVGKELAQLETEEKIVKLYNFDQKAEVNTKVDVLTELLGQEIIAGVILETQDKNVKDASGNYVASGQTRDVNVVDKFFRARDRKTVAEILAKADDATFIDQWNEKWAGKVRNRAKGATAGAQGAAAPAATARPSASLFS